MTDHIDDWYKLASYDTNLQAELHANLLQNNGIAVSKQALSAIPGMNSGEVLWVKQNQLVQAQQILDSIDTNANLSDSEEVATDNYAANVDDADFINSPNDGGSER